MFSDETESDDMVVDLVMFVTVRGDEGDDSGEEVRRVMIKEERVESDESSLGSIRHSNLFDDALHLLSHLKLLRLLLQCHLHRHNPRMLCM
jgi:hypothetical protein